MRYSLVLWPCLLLRSGFKSDHVGKHLRLHPVTGVVAEFQGKKMEVWSGAPMTTVCKVAEMGPTTARRRSKSSVFKFLLLRDNKDKISLFDISVRVSELAGWASHYRMPWLKQEES